MSQTSRHTPPQTPVHDPPQGAARSYDPPHTDEISIRDLYLVLRRGLPIVLIAAALAGGGAFVASSLMTPIFEATSTTLVTPPPIEVESTGGLTFQPNTSVLFESYETLANSDAVVQATTESVPQVTMGVNQFLANSSVRQLLGPQQRGQTASLAVVHSVRHPNPDTAVALADAWATQSLDTVRSSLQADLGPIGEATQQELDVLETRLDEAEAALEAFEQQDQTDLLSARIERLIENIAEGESGRVALTEFTALPNSELLSVPEANLGQEIAANNALLAALQGQQASTPALAAQITFRQALSSSLERRQQVLNEQLETYRSDLAAAQQTLARLNRQRSQLERRLQSADLAYRDFSALQAPISYMTQVASGSSRVLSQASRPGSPVAPQRQLNTVLAAGVGAVLAVVFVFLREAVRRSS